jgi:hypothetical protein
MSRSSPPRSPIAESLRRSSEGQPPRPPYRRSLGRRLRIHTAALLLWLHIYLSMLGLAAILFFSVTGLTLNHPDWFSAGGEVTTQAEGEMDAAWLGAGGVDRLAVVEFLRAEHGVRGAVADFRADDPEVSVTFRGPGYSADAFIDRASGHYTLSQSAHGLVAIINDLHKGRDTGRGWSVVIDVSAIVMTIVSLTGLALLFFLRLRRVAGLIVMLVGTIAVLAAFWWLVP